MILCLGECHGSGSFINLHGFSKIGPPRPSATKPVDMGLRQLLLLDAVPLVVKEELPLISFLSIPAESYIPYFDKDSLLQLRLWWESELARDASRGSHCSCVMPRPASRYMYSNVISSIDWN